MLKVSTFCSGVGSSGTTDEITIEMVKEKLYYKDGNLYWAIKPSNSININDLAGSNNKGRLRTKIYGKCYFNSRLIFLYHYGYLPEIIDHLDRNPLNNKIENLREATRIQNSKNRTVAKSSVSRFLGVHLLITRKKLKSNIIKEYRYWAASIRVNKILIHLGTFPNTVNGEINAAITYNEAAVKYHKEFANLNKL